MKVYYVHCERLGETATHRFDGRFREAVSRARFEEFKNEGWASLHLVYVEPQVDPFGEHSIDSWQRGY